MKIAFTYIIQVHFSVFGKQDIVVTALLWSMCIPSSVHLDLFKFVQIKISILYTDFKIIWDPVA